MNRKILGAMTAVGAFARSGALATGGGIAIPFAISIVPLTMLAVAGIDFERSQAVRAQLQDALDAATLTVGRSTVTDPAAVQKMGSDALATNLQLPTGVVLKTASFALSGSKVVSSATVKVKAMETDVFTEGTILIGARSEVQRAMYKLEVALVLDNTGSMAGTKLSLLKTAANNFVDTLAEAAGRSVETDTVKIGLVPFSQTVNVGSQYRSQSWIDQAGASPINDEIFANSSGPTHANRFTLLSNMGVSWGGCVESRKMPYDVQETAPDTANPVTLFTPYFAPDEPSNDDTYKNDYLDNDGTTSSTWWVRQGNVPKYSHAPNHSGPTGMGYKFGPNSGCELAPLVRLTTQTSTVKAGINSMTAIGDTNIPMGLAWGWHELSPLGPFADGQAYGTKQLQKVVVLMTDGQNQNTYANNGNASYYSGIGYIWQNRLGIGASSTQGQRQQALDGRLTALCANMKAKGIVIYTVRVDVHDSNYAVLKNCATTPQMFFDVDDASDLDDTFKAIAGSIQNLRLSS